MTIATRTNTITKAEYEAREDYSCSCCGSAYDCQHETEAVHYPEDSFDHMTTIAKPVSVFVATNDKECGFSTSVSVSAIKVAIAYGVIDLSRTESWVKRVRKFDGKVDQIVKRPAIRYWS